MSSSPQQQQQGNKPKPEDVLGPAPAIAPDVWSAVANTRVPDDAWEFHARKNANDAAYQGLDFSPYCSTMPVVPATATVSSTRSSSTAAADDNECRFVATATPKWAWKKKAPR